MLNLASQIEAPSGQMNSVASDGDFPSRRTFKAPKNVRLFNAPKKLQLSMVNALLFGALNSLVFFGALGTDNFFGAINSHRVRQGRLNLHETLKILHKTPPNPSEFMKEIQIKSMQQTNFRHEIFKTILVKYY